MNKVNTLSGVLVGMRFRPPAKPVLAALAAGAVLRLEAEPSNPHDEFAVKVLVSPREIAESAKETLAVELPGYGFDLEELLKEEEIFLGYIASKANKVLRDRADLVSNEIFLEAQTQVAWTDCEITLGFDMKGLPLVVLKAQG